MSKNGVSDIYMQNKMLVEKIPFRKAITDPH